MATTFADLTTSWQQISATATTVQITAGTVLMQVATAQPASTDTRGHVFENRDLPGIGWGAQTGGEKLYARALQGSASIVMTPDIG
ncbi:hypothetical protein ACFZ8E_15295 [Methylobacterium sp. HMF5984]|uniref:hypothetical protein n=1 Tax=unclassified Methylobacterium TaxID=2615210 RepID=UPI001FB95632|nr:hypothetical protein [Methylobacterium sp. E-025]MCJ2114702.1 hypothetical protein [Methylobacterium sp. E-025]